MAGAPPGASAQGEDRRLLVGHELQHRLVAHAQEALDVGGRTIPQADPDQFRRRAEYEAEPVKVLVLGDEDVALTPSVRPDGSVGPPWRPTRVTRVEPE